MEEGVSRGEDPEDHGIRRRGRCDLARAGLAEEEDDGGSHASAREERGERDRATEGEGIRARRGWSRPVRLAGGPRGRPPGC